MSTVRVKRPIPPVKDVFPDEGLRNAAAAAEKGDVAGIKATGATLDKVVPMGVNLLMYEIASQNEVAVRALLEAGADPNFVTESNASPMLVAAASDDKRWLEILLDKGGDPNLADHDGEPLITKMVSYERWDNMNLLLDKGAEIDKTGPSGQTATFRLAALNLFDRVEAMIDRGADPQHAEAGGMKLEVFLRPPLPEESPQIPYRDRLAERLGVSTTSSSSEAAK